MVTGTHTWRVWYGGETQQRLALVGSLGESDIVRNGKDLWVWSSQEKTAVHYTLPEHRAGEAKTAPDMADLPKTPEEAAERALAALDPTTEVTTSGAAVVAGRPAYELVLKPRNSASLVASVRISVDAEKYIPLRVQAYSTRLGEPRLRGRFHQHRLQQARRAAVRVQPAPGHDGHRA